MNVAVQSSPGNSFGMAPNNGNLSGSITARDIVRGIFYYKRPMAIAFIIPTLLGFGAAALRAPTYTAEARLLVLPGQEYAYTPETGTAAPDLTMDRTQFAQSEAAILRDVGLQTKTLQEIGPEKVVGSGYDPNQPDALPKAVAQMSSDLSINSLPLSNAITLNYRNTNPDIAAAVLNELVKLYLAARPAVYNRSALTTLVAQRDQYAKRLHDADQEVQDYSRQHDITNLDSQTDLLLKQRADLEQQKVALRQRIDSNGAQIAQLRLQLARVPQNVQQFVDTSRSVASDVRSGDLARLLSERDEMATRYQPDAPQLLDLDRRISVAQAQARGPGGRDMQAARLGRNPLYDDLSATLARAVADQDGLEASSAALDNASTAQATRLKELDDASEHYHTLLRNRDVVESAYKSAAQDAEKAQVNDELDSKRYGNVRLVQAATPPAVGSNTRRLLALAGIGLGLVFAFATLTVLSALRQVAIDPADAERGLGLPVLLTVNLGSNRRARQGYAPDRRPA